MLKKKPEAETGICSHDVSLNMVQDIQNTRDLFGRGGGGYVKYIINISNYITGITINQINYVMILLNANKTKPTLSSNI